MTLLIITIMIMIIMIKGSLVRKLPQYKKLSHKIRAHSEVKSNREGYLCSACGFTTGSQRSRHGGGKLPTGTAAQTVSEVQIAWQARHFGNLRCRFRGRRSILCPRKVKYRFRGRRSIFARSSTGFVAGAALSQGQVIDR